MPSIPCRAAATKPFGFTPFYPGLGLGGHCIPIDPFYLTWEAREFGIHTRFIELAGQINRAMPEYVVHRTMIALNEAGKAVKGSRILLLGLAYKADVDDMRESPTFELMDRFQALGAEVSYHDPHVPEIGPTREHAKRFSSSWLWRLAAERMLRESSDAEITERLTATPLSLTILSGLSQTALPARSAFLLPCSCGVSPLSECFVKAQTRKSRNGSLRHLFHSPFSAV